MILSFKNIINGKPTFFLEKIKACMCYKEELKANVFFNFYLKLEHDLMYALNCIPKIHTIREDKTNRWKAGVLIHAAYFVRQKNKQRQIAPTFVCVSVQDIQIHHIGFDLSLRVIIDNNIIDDNIKKVLYQNDGFENELDFDIFCRIQMGKKRKNIIVAKIIHFTDFKY